MKEVFVVFVDGEHNLASYHNTKEGAEKEAKNLADKISKKVYVIQTSAFFYADVNVDSYESACEYLGRENDSLACGCDNRHHKAMVAMFKLVTIAEAWNREDDFVPDFSNKKQFKYYPWFIY